MGWISGPLPTDEAAMTPPHPQTGSENEALSAFIYEPFAKDRACFLCSLEIETYPMVYWSGAPALGANGQRLIFLHPECAAKLGAHLLQDAGRTEPDVGKQPH